MMRLYFDISALPEVGRSVTGISRVALGILTALTQLGRKDFSVFGISFRTDEMQSHPDGRLWSLGEIAECGGDLFGVEELAPEVRDHVPDVIQAGDVIVCLGEQWLFPNAVSTIKRLKARSGVRVYTLVHDLVPFFMPDLYWDGFTACYMDCLNQLVECSDGILVNSHNTESDLLRWIPLAEGKPITRLHLGTELPKISGVLAKDWVPPKEPYVLCVGTIQPRKNHALLLMAWRYLVQQRPEDCPNLVLVGKRGWHSDDLLYFIRSNPILKARIAIMEQPTDADLWSLYRNAWVTVYPSLYEGWGLPISESLTAGKLCLCSNSSSMPEVGGDLAVYFSPYDPMGLCRAIEGFLDDPDSLALAEQRIRNRYLPYTWQQCALELLDGISNDGVGHKDYDK